MPEIIILTETWLNENITNNELFGNTYNVYRRDRVINKLSKKKDGGGVLIAISKKFNSKHMKVWQSNCEDVWVTVDIPISKKCVKLVLCAVYLPPPVSNSLMENFISNCNRVSELHQFHTCIVGDFNLGNIDWTASPLPTKKTTSLVCDSFIDFCDINNLKQCNNIVNKSDRILDLVLTDFPVCRVTKAIDSLCKVDPLHPPLEIEITTLSSARLNYSKSNKRYNFFKSDYKSINEHLAKVNWTSVFDKNLSVNDMTTKFYTTLFKIIDAFVPISKPKNNKYPPWLSLNFIKRLKEKRKLLQRYKIYKNPMDEISLRLLSERCSKLGSQSYRNYLTSVEQNIHKCPKHFFNYVNNIRKSASSYPKTLTDGQTFASNGKEICDLFAKHFSSIYNDNKNPNNHFSTNNNDRIHNNMLITPNNNSIFSSIKITKDEILKKLQKLNTNKGAGSDNIPPIFIASCAFNLVEPLFYIYNKSLETGEFPEMWKEAKVVPVHKSGDDTLVNHYRPISILPQFSKIFEDLLCPSINFHFKHYLSDNQHGFVKGRSTTTNMVAFTDAITQGIDKRLQIDAIYTDLSKAFDTVPHSTLILKLSAYGFTGPMLKWFSSYLRDRFFHVSVNGYQSNNYTITSGVPQGSHLGPILFNIFINDVSCNFKESTPFLFADDLKFIRVIKSTEDSSLLQDDLDRLSNWCQVNNMTLNISKCQHIKFSRNNNIVSSSYFINGVQIEEVDNIRDLGIVLDSKLTYISHIDQIIKKASKNMGFIIRTTKQFSKSSTKIILYNVLVRTIIEYGSVIWRPHYSTHSLRIERLQKRFLRHVAYSAGVAKQLHSYEDRLRFFKLVSLNERRDALDLKFLHKLINNQIDCPMLLSALNFNVPRCLPRSQIKPLSVPFRRTVLGANSTIPRLCRLLNKCSGSTNIFDSSSYKFSKEITTCLV